MVNADALVIGAGIVGAACAWELAAAGVRVRVLEREHPAAGATAAGMGHIIVLDDSPAQFALTRWSQRRWAELAPAMPASAQVSACGCLWVASGEEQMAVVRSKASAYRAAGLPAEVLDARALAAAEPNLRPGLAGGLLLPADQVVYPPVVTRWLLDRAVKLGAEVRAGVRVVRAHAGRVECADGSVHEADVVVVAAGHESLAVLARVPEGVVIRPRKGHLAITAPAPGFCRHQLVELGYLRSAHTDNDASVAFNVQPRVTGQVLIGSSRQYRARDRRVEPAMLARMLRRATEFMPALAALPVTRAWVGFRAATPDKLPLIGPVPGQPGLYLATGHEGVGITTSLATGRLIADLVTARPPALDPRPYRVDRPERAA